MQASSPDSATDVLSYDSGDGGDSRKFLICSYLLATTDVPHYRFPIGTMATATTLLAKELDSEGFRVLAMILSVSVVILWLYIATRTAIEAVKGTVLCVQFLALRRT